MLLKSAHITLNRLIWIHSSTKMAPTLIPPPKLLSNNIFYLAWFELYLLILPLKKMEENTNMYLVLVPGFLLDNLVEAKKKIPNHRKVLKHRDKT